MGENRLWRVFAGAAPRPPNVSVVAALQATRHPSGRFGSVVSPPVELPPAQFLLLPSLSCYRLRPGWQRHVLTWAPWSTVTARTARLYSVLRHTVVVILVTGLTLALIELSIARLWPQVPRTVNLDGEPLGMQDELASHRYRPNVRAVHQSPEFTVEYRINAAGHRDETIHVMPKPASLTRILLLGDSFTFGQGTRYERSWPTIVERQLRSQGYHVDVVKAGVQGYSTRDEVLQLEQLYAEFEPDIVVLVFLPNDLYANTPIADSMPHNTGATARPGGIRRLSAGALQTVMLAQRALAANDWLYMKLYMMTPWATYYSVPPSAAFLAQVDVTARLLTRAQEFCQAHGAQFLVLSVPQQFQVLAAAHTFGHPNTDVYLIDRTLAEIAAASDLRWINTLDVLAERYRRDREDLYFRFDGHLNEAGNRMLAEYFTTIFLDHFGADLKRRPHRHARR